MKKIIFVLIGVLFSLGLFAQDEVVVIQFDGKEFPVKIGDNLEVGYGTNPYGSFMYIAEAGDHEIAMPKDYAGRIFEVKNIKTYPKRNEYWIRIVNSKALYFFKVAYDTGRCQALEVGEVVSINGVEVQTEE